MLPALIAAGAIAAQAAATMSGNQQSQQNAEEQMKFQGDMASSAHQREVQDLRAAGLNPILSANGSGAAVPAGAQGSVSDLGQSISRGIDTGVALRQQNKDFEQKDAQIENTSADTSNKHSQSALIDNQASASAMDIKQKAMQNRIIEQTMPSVIKKAKAEGDYADVNQMLGVIGSGINSAGSLLNIPNILKNIALPKGK